MSASPNLHQLIARYDALLLDAYGVLVDKVGPLPGAREAVAQLNAAGKPYFIVTNAASRLPEGMAAAFQEMGLAIEADRFVTSGGLLPAFFRQQGLEGSRVIVLGPETAWEYATLAGGKCVPPDQDAEVVVIADQSGFPLLETLNAVLNVILRRLDRGDPIHLILPNPDLVYPTEHGHLGLTAGALAATLEAVLHERYPTQKPSFVRLGKPFPPIFHAALERAGSRNVLMIGDQLATDIAGAQRAGLDALLLTTGVSPATLVTEDITPTFIISGWATLLDPA